MKTIIRITQDYYSELSHDYWLEYIKEIVNDIDIYCEIENNKFNDVINENQRYYSKNKEEYDSFIEVNSKGYSQDEWQTYKIWYNKDEFDQILYLKELLEKQFTHKNDYLVEKFEQEEINGKKFNSDPFDYTQFVIDNIEFPDEEDIINTYLDVYGKDFDEYIINI